MAGSCNHWDLQNKSNKLGCSLNPKPSVSVLGPSCFTSLLGRCKEEAQAEARGAARGGGAGGGKVVWHLKALVTKLNGAVHKGPMDRHSTNASKFMCFGA